MGTGKIVWVGGRDNDRRILDSILKNAGLPEVGFATPAGALELVQRRELDLLMVDVSQAGADILQLIRAAAPSANAITRVPVMVTSAYNTPERVQACLSRGAEDYLITPFDEANPLLVARRIDLCLQRKRDPEFRVSSNGKGPDETAVIQLYTDASNKFVPREFLENLERKTLAEVKLGDHVQRDMTVFFTDIRDFTTLSETLTPQQNFRFLNSYLKHVTPIIRKYEGFIDKYIGDAVMALFPRKTDAAVQAAIEVQQQIVKYNIGRRKAGYIPISMGIGMHRGDLILGTVGEGNRMQTTVIADAVNVASRIEGLTKTFGVSILLSKAVVDALTPEHTFKLRHLGAVKAKGKKQSVEIYECFNNDHPELVEHKEKTLEQFEIAMTEFRKGMFLTAGKIFSRIAEINKEDTVAAYYRDRCTLTVVSKRGPGPWDGAETVETK